MQAAGWYADPTGRHEWRYWRPGWSELAADGAVEVTDPVRPIWRRNLGIVLIAQLVLVPIIGFIFISQGDPLAPRAGVMLVSGQTAPTLQVVYAPCSGERIEHVVLSLSNSKGSTQDVIWSVKGATAAATPIDVGTAPVGMKTRERLAGPIHDDAHLVLGVQTNQLGKPDQLRFDVADVPSSGVLGYDGTYPDRAAFDQAALSATPCGSQSNRERALLADVLILEAVLALVGVALVLWPRYPGPTSPYA